MIKTVIKHDDEYYYDVIRRNLKRIRIEKKVTQDMLGEMTDLSRQYICDIENKNRNKHIYKEDWVDSIYCPLSFQRRGKGNHAGKD